MKDVAFLGGYDEPIVAFLLSDNVDEGDHRVMLWTNQSGTPATSSFTWTRGIPSELDFTFYTSADGLSLFSPDIVVTLADYPMMLIFETDDPIDYTDLAASFSAAQVINTGVAVDNFRIRNLGETFSNPVYIVVSNETENTIRILAD